MSYPYGQPPHQPVFPAPEPGFPAPGPGYPGPFYAAAPNPYGYPQPAPSGGTGITAGIFALLGALAGVFMGLAMNPCVIVAPALLIGGIMLLKRSNVGRITVMVSCVAFVVVSIIPGLGLIPIITDLFAILTLVLAAVGPTKRWVEAPQNPAMPGGHPPVLYGY